MRTLGRLSAVAVSRMTKPGRYGDGGGLWLQVSRSGTKAWLFRYTRTGRARQMGLGPVHTVTLAEARERARGCRRQLLDGLDPIEARRAERFRARLDAARALTFRQSAEQYIAIHKAGWKNDKHKAQWPATLEAYVYPIFGELPVAAIDTTFVLKAIQPIWTSKPETAGRVRGRIEAVLDWAAARGYRTGENPARWRGHLDKLLPPRRKVARVRHHAALLWRELPCFMQELRRQHGTSARALEFAILMAARTGEVIGARWSEIDAREKVWVIPGERMKGGREHRVPLSDRALDILEKMPREDGNEHIFIGSRANRSLSQMALLMTLRRMGRSDLTVHGFRSSFCDWAAETTGYPREVTEMALAHAVSDQVEAAYRRGDLFAKRRRLMADWAKYCASPPLADDKVLALREAPRG